MARDNRRMLSEEYAQSIYERYGYGESLFSKEKYSGSLKSWEREVYVGGAPVMPSMLDWMARNSVYCVLKSVPKSRGVLLDENGEGIGTDNYAFNCRNWRVRCFPSSICKPQYCDAELIDEKECEPKVKENSWCSQASGQKNENQNVKRSSPLIYVGVKDQVDVMRRCGLVASSEKDVVMKDKFEGDCNRLISALGVPANFSRGNVDSIDARVVTAPPIVRVNDPSRPVTGITIMQSPTRETFQDDLDDYADVCGEAIAEYDEKLVAQLGPGISTRSRLWYASAQKQLHLDANVFLPGESRWQGPVSPGTLVTPVLNSERIAVLSNKTSGVVFNMRLNPGSKRSFPWLSTVARNYTNSVLRGMVIEIRPRGLVPSTFIERPSVVVRSGSSNISYSRSFEELKNHPNSTVISMGRTLIHFVDCGAATCGGRTPNRPDGCLPSLLIGEQYFQIGSGDMLVGQYYDVWVHYHIDMYDALVLRTRNRRTMVIERLARGLDLVTMCERYVRGGMPSDGIVELREKVYVDLKEVYMELFNKIDSGEGPIVPPGLEEYLPEGYTDG